MTLSRLLSIPLLAAVLLVPAPVHAAAFPSLDDVVRRAQSRAPAAVDAAGATRAAEALGAGARLGPFGNPSFEITGDRSYLTKDVNLVAAAYLPIEVQGQRGARIQEWERLVQWRRADARDASTRTLRDATESYGAVAVTRSRLTQAERGRADARSEVEAVTARLAAGDATAYELSLAEAEVARWSQLRAESAAGHSQALGRLGELVGEPIDAPPAMEARAPELRELLPRESFASWFATNPTLRALEAEGQYWNASAERSRKDAWSPLSVVVTGGRGDFGEGRVGGGLAWSFPVIRRNQGEIARAEAEQTRAAALRAAVRDALNARARSTAETYELTRAAAVELEKTGLLASERVVQAALDAQRAGKGDLTRVLIARRDLATARARQLDLVDLSWRAYAQLAAMKGALP